MQKFRIEAVSVTTRLSYGRRPRPSFGRSTFALVHSVAVANIKSQIKRNRQNERRRQRNKSVRSALKTSSKKVRTTAAEGDAQAAEQQLREAARALDKAAAKGALHRRTAARHKSRLAKATRGALASQETSATPAAE